MESLVSLTCSEQRAIQKPHHYQTTMSGTHSMHVITANGLRLRQITSAKIDNLLKIVFTALPLAIALGARPSKTR